jgi:hypothetical protein
MSLSLHFQEYKEAMLTLPADRALTKEDLLTDKFLMNRHGSIETYYAPHNEYVNPAARVVIIGITPGFSQMRAAYQIARAGLAEGLPETEICKRAKEGASFAGSMRHNLVSMLDQLGLPDYLGLSTSGELFEQQRSLLHTTSLLRYPVFVNQRNYSGSAPDLLSSSYLWEMSHLSILKELSLLERKEQALIIPLGIKVEAALSMLIREGKLTASQCLSGFPHPSGANGHRYSQFSARFKSMQAAMREFLENTSGHA